VALATECATMEQEIERKLQLGLEHAQKEFQTRNWDIDDRLRTLKEKIGLDYHQRISEADAQFESQNRTIRSADEKSRASTDVELRKMHQEVKSSLDQAVWLAESV